MLAAPGPESIGEAQEIDLVDLVEHPHHGLLDDLVLQGRDAQRSLSSVGLRDEDATRRLRPVGALMDPSMEIAEPIFEADVVLLPRDAVNSRGRFVLEREEAFPESLDGHVVQQGGEPCTPVPACHLSHTIQSGQRIEPALCPGCGRLHRVPLGRSPSLHHLRRRVGPGSVRRLLRYYATVRLPRGVRAGGTVMDLLRPTRRTISGYPWDLPFPVRRVSTHAQGLRLRGVRGRLADDAVLGVAFRFA